MINTADNQNKVGGAGAAGQPELEKSNSLIYLGAAQTANQSGTAAVAAQQPAGEVDRVKQMGELSQQERKQLRQARFGVGKDQIPGLQEAATTIEALELIEEQKRKKMERAERFGIVTKELSEKRIKERQERFGIQTKESIEAKKQERMKRFGTMEQASMSGITSEELEAKRKARMERFGKEAVQEAQRSVTQTAAEG